MPKLIYYNTREMICKVLYIKLSHIFINILVLFSKGYGTNKPDGKRICYTAAKIIELCICLHKPGIQIVSEIIHSVQDDTKVERSPPRHSDQRTPKNLAIFRGPLTRSGYACASKNLTITKNIQKHRRSRPPAVL